jgi:hypothetical protein
MKSLISILLFLSPVEVFSQMRIDSMETIFFKEDLIDTSSIDVTPYQLFNPTIQEVKVADSIAKFWLSNPEKMKSIYRYGFQAGLDHLPIYPYERYYRQYLGLIMNGQHVIYINALGYKKGYFETFFSHPVGGGGLFFQIKIQLSEKRAFDLQVNDPL